MKDLIHITFGIIGVYALIATSYYVFTLCHQPKDVHQLYWTNHTRIYPNKSVFWTNFNLVMAVIGLGIILYCGTSGIFSFIPKDWRYNTGDGETTSVAEYLAGLVATVGIVYLSILYGKCADAFIKVEYLEKHKNNLEYAMKMIVIYSRNKNDFDRFMLAFTGSDQITVDWNKVRISKEPEVNSLIINSLCGYGSQYKL